MRLCPNCDYHNREGALYCEECGHPLKGEITQPTRSIAVTQAMDSVLEVARELREASLNTFNTFGTAHFDPSMRFVITVRDTEGSIEMRPERSPLIIGRSDTGATQIPDLDFSPFGALEKGVSRTHAAILREDTSLSLVDMGSSNGTFLNGQRLLRDQPRVIRDGDEIRLGKMVAHIYFKR